MVSKYVFGPVFVATIGAALAGFHIGSINGMFEMPGFQSTFSQLFELSDNCSVDSSTGTLSSEFENVTATCGVCTSTAVCGGSGTEASSILGLMVSIANIGAAFGAAIGGWPSTAFGRRLTLSISGLIMAVGSLLSAASFHTWLFIIGRAISGFSMGLSYGVIPLYISEISPREYRGRLASLIGPVYGFTLMAQFAGNCGFSSFCAGWRVSLTVQVAFGLAYAFLMLLTPKTPRWLVLHNRHQEAHIVLAKINNCPLTTMLELEDLRDTTDGMSTSYCRDLKKQFELTVKWKYLKRLLLCTLIFVFTPPIGNFTYYFGNTFFCKLSISPCTSNIIVGASLFIGGIVTTLMIDKAGRKLILLLGTLILLVCQGLIVSVIRVFNLEEEEHVGAGYALTVLFCLYAVVYAGSWVTTPWVISSEIFPVETRGLKVAIATTTFWISAAVSTQIIPIVIDSVLGISGYMCLLLGITFLAFLLVLLGIPETKGTSLECMDDLFEKPWLERVNLVYYLSCGISDVVQRIKKKHDVGEIRSTEIECKEKQVYVEHK